MCFNPSQVGYKPTEQQEPKKSKAQFQSLTGRLQTRTVQQIEAWRNCFNPSQVGYKPEEFSLSAAEELRFNPSQVGYKRAFAGTGKNSSQRFNPSQVGYKLHELPAGSPPEQGFNPSQVGYKLAQDAVASFRQATFQSLTGRLQTRLSCIFIKNSKKVSIPHR